MNQAIDNGMESPNEYANSNIGTYAYKPAMGYTDWRKELLRTAMHQSYEASVSGGNDRSTFYASLRYNNQEGMAKNSSLPPPNRICSRRCSPMEVSIPANSYRAITSKNSTRISTTDSMTCFLRWK